MPDESDKKSFDDRSTIFCFFFLFLFSFPLERIYIYILDSHLNTLLSTTQHRLYLNEVKHNNFPLTIYIFFSCHVRKTWSALLTVRHPSWDWRISPCFSHRQPRFPRREKIEGNTEYKHDLYFTRRIRDEDREEVIFRWSDTSLLTPQRSFISSILLCDASLWRSVYGSGRTVSQNGGRYRRVCLR